MYPCVYIYMYIHTYVVAPPGRALGAGRGLGPVVVGGWRGRDLCFAQLFSVLFSYMFEFAS